MTNEKDELEKEIEALKFEVNHKNRELKEMSQNKSPSKAQPDSSKLST